MFMPTNRSSIDDQTSLPALALYWNNVLRCGSNPPSSTPFSLENEKKQCVNEDHTQTSCSNNSINDNNNNSDNGEEGGREVDVMKLLDSGAMHFVQEFEKNNPACHRALELICDAINSTPNVARSFALISINIVLKHAISNRKELLVDIVNKIELPIHRVLQQEDDRQLYSPDLNIRQWEFDANLAFQVLTLIVGIKKNDAVLIGYEIQWENESIDLLKTIDICRIIENTTWYRLKLSILDSITPLLFTFGEQYFSNALKMLIADTIHFLASCENIAAYGQMVSSLSDLLREIISHAEDTRKWLFESPSNLQYLSEIFVKCLDKDIQTCANDLFALLCSSITDGYICKLLIPTCTGDCCSQDITDMITKSIDWVFSNGYGNNWNISSILKNNGSIHYLTLLLRNYSYKINRDEIPETYASILATTISQCYRALVREESDDTELILNMFLLEVESIFFFDNISPNFIVEQTELLFLCTDIYVPPQELYRLIYGILLAFANQSPSDLKETLVILYWIDFKECMEFFLNTLSEDFNIDIQILFAQWQRIASIM
jgi:hypothetical protein